jgi:hypothetical protein
MPLVSAEAESRGGTEICWMSGCPFFAGMSGMWERDNGSAKEGSQSKTEDGDEEILPEACQAQD